MRASIKVLTFAIAASALLNAKPASAFPLSSVQQAVCSSPAGRLTLNRQVDSAVLELKGKPVFINGADQNKRAVFINSNGPGVKLVATLRANDSSRAPGVAMLSSGRFQDLKTQEELTVAFVNPNGAAETYLMNCFLRAQ